MVIETQPTKPQRIVSCTLLCLAILFAVIVRCRLAGFPMDRDEGEYALSGQLLLQGIPPYKVAHNMKLPGTYLVYAGIMTVFGQTPEGIRFGMLAFNLATIALLYILARDLFDEVTA